MLPLAVGRMPRGMMVLCAALSFDGKGQLPDCEQPENVSSGCSENCSWLAHWELRPRKHLHLSTPPSLYPLPVLQDLLFNYLWEWSPKIYRLVNTSRYLYA